MRSPVRYQDILSSDFGVSVGGRCQECVNDALAKFIVHMGVKVFVVYVRIGCDIHNRFFGRVQDVGDGRGAVLSMVFAGRDASGNVKLQPAGRSPMQIRPRSISHQILFRFYADVYETQIGRVIPRVAQGCEMCWPVIVQTNSRPCDRTDTGVAWCACLAVPFFKTRRWAKPMRVAFQ